MEEIQNSTLKGVLKKIGFGALSIVVLADIGMLVAVGVDSANGKKGADIGLLVGGVHLKEGNHNFVITDQFYDLLKYEDEKDKKLVMDSFKLAYNNFNYLNSNKLHFTLCTTNSEASKEFNLPLISSYSKYDVPLYIHDGDIQGNKLTAGATTFDVENVTRYLKNETITFKKSSLLGVYKMFGSEEEVYDISNAFAYTICAHETMHVMGFEHRSKDSILYPYIPSPYKDFTELDKNLLIKYNQEFYGATPDYVKNQEEKPEQEEKQQNFIYTTNFSDDLCQ